MGSRRIGSIGVLAAAALGWAGCSGNSISGEVEGVAFLEVLDGFYAQVTVDELEYYAVVLADFDDACNRFNAGSSELGDKYNVLQIWLSDPDVAEYPVFDLRHLEDEGSAHSLVWARSELNGTEVLNTDAVAGVVVVTDYRYEDQVIAGSMDAIFSGNGNRLQATFKVEYCELDPDALLELLP